MIAQPSGSRGIQQEFEQIRSTARRIRESWSPEERRRRFLRGRQKRAEILGLLIGRPDLRRQAGGNLSQAPDGPFRRERPWC